MPFTPMKRSELNNLKSSTEEKNRRNRVEGFIGEIYTRAVALAKIGTVTSYNHPIPVTKYPLASGRTQIIYDDFYRLNMVEILKGLQELFPDSKVKHAVLSTGADGKLHDISCLTDIMLPAMIQALDQSYIVVDWT
jgi:hypothetical protein